MIELTFRADLYALGALSAAASVYAKVANCEVEEGPEYHRVRLTATGRVEESRIADEFGNYALGATVDRRGPSAGVTTGAP